MNSNLKISPSFFFTLEPKTQENKKCGVTSSPSSKKVQKGSSIKAW